MSTLMVTIQSPKGTPDLDSIKRRYGLSDDEIDKNFGVVEIDPEDHTYTILVDEKAAGKVTSTADWKVMGTYSNPRIEAFGPPQP
jgi:hypothetical protein